MRRALVADRYVAGSRFLVRSWRDAGWLPGAASVEVVPYGIPYAMPGRPRGERVLRRPLRFGFVGALMPHKGVHVAVEAFCGVSPDAARLRIWGDPLADPAYVERMLGRTGGADVRIEGRFPEGEKSRVFSDMDVLLVPSIGLESYGIVVDEAMAHGIPVVASRRGALPERFEESCGAFFPAGDPGALREVIERLVARPEAIDEWRRALPPVRTLEDAAERIEEIYAGLFVARGSR